MYPDPISGFSGVENGKRPWKLNILHLLILQALVLEKQIKSLAEGENGNDVMSLWQAQQRENWPRDRRRLPIAPTGGWLGEGAGPLHLRPNGRYADHSLTLKYVPGHGMSLLPGARESICVD